MAKALDDAALALVTEARDREQARARWRRARTRRTGGRELREDVHHVVRRQGVPARRLDRRETTDLVALYHAGADSPGTYNEGIDLVTRAILQSVGFLYVTALGAGDAAATITLTPQELASNLSYLVAGGPPDRTLLDMAHDQRLGDAGRARDAGAPAARRCRPGAIAWCAWCASGWASTASRRPRRTPPSTRASPTAVRTSMDTETKKFIDEVVQRSTGTVGELLSANWSIVDSTLAPIYGVTSAGATAHTNLPKRLGILNQAAFLSVFAHAQETAPVLRGVAVMRRVACMKLPDPQSLNIQVVPPAPDPAKSTRDRFDIHATDAALRQLPRHHRPDRLLVRDVRRDGRSSARPERPRARSRTSTWARTAR